MNDAQGLDLDERTAGQWWYSNEEKVTVSVHAVQSAGEEILQRVGAEPHEAEFLFGVFLDKAIQGDHTRGLVDIPANVRRIVDGMPLRPVVNVVRETSSTALVDSDTAPIHWFHNMLLARAGTTIAIEKARSTGIGMANLRVPLVIAGAHVQQIIDAGQVAIAMTQSFPMVAPFGGRVPELGNAPVAFGLPAGRNDPVIIDMSITQTSSSGVKAAAQQGLSVPAGFLLDEFGEPTTDPAAYPAVGYGWHDHQRSRGSLTPLGNSHKGYALIFVVGLLAAVLTDTSFPWEATEVSMGSPRGPGERYGSLILAIDPRELLGTEISSRVDAYIDHLRESPTRDGVAEILFPGEKSQRLRRSRRDADVFALPRSHYEAFVELAREFSISL